ncbi:wax ester/triacylglycerol synthase family O-acyltransferase [Myxococcota bacterium]|nr:wax ester/triacylglycerol synthase family O-acyltransferase [Myxococcota bacterium]
MDRVSALDAAFLDSEAGGAHMHIGALAVFDGRGLLGPDGGVDFERISRHVEAELVELPRLRQCLTKVPGLGSLAWTDDPHFLLRYHLRHTALPRPGDDRQLKRLAGRIFSQRLDRDRPLWELWVVEGLSDGRFALVLKAHHSLVDGVGGVKMLAALFGPEATDVERWIPTPRPSPIELVKGELGHRAEAALAQTKTLRSLATKPRDLLAGVKAGLEETGHLVMKGFTPGAQTPLNPEEIGPHRRFDTVQMPLSELKAIRRTLGGKLNDVVVAITTSALRRFFERRNVDPKTLTNFRALVPVNVRGTFDGAGNHFAMMFSRLPFEEPDPKRRYDVIVAESTQTKGEEGHARASELLEDASDWALPSFVSVAFRFAAWVKSFNLLLTNVPGPQFPLTLLGAPLVELYPLAPLFKTQALSVAVFSYDGRLGWGLNADWELVPDLHLFADDLRAAFEELRALG